MTQSFAKLAAFVILLYPMDNSNSKTLLRHVLWFGLLHYKILIIFYLLIVIFKLHLFIELQLLWQALKRKLHSDSLRTYPNLSLVYYKISVGRLIWLFNSSKLVNDIEDTHTLPIVAFQKTFSLRNESTSSIKMPEEWWHCWNGFRNMYFPVVIGIIICIT